MKKNLIILFTTFILGAIWYYFFLPAINIHSLGFWFWIGIMLATYSFIGLLLQIDEKGRIRHIEKSTIVAFSSIFIILVLKLVINYIIYPLIQSKDYSKRIKII